MINFYPGPSKVYPEVRQYMQDAFDADVLGLNHRSQEFMTICKRTVELMREKLNIPQDYQVFFTSSATECWEIIGQSLTKKYSYHIFNGAFGKKWFEYTQKQGKIALGHKFGIQQPLNFEKLPIEYPTEIICITHNETSNGTKVSDAQLATFKKRYIDQLVAIDATSSLAGEYINIADTDITLASVQKCFGLPAGLGILICSPRAMVRANFIKEKDHYNSLILLEEHMKNFQTSYTPNVLNIYLLMRVMEKTENIKSVSDKIKGRADEMYKFFSGTRFTPLIEDINLRSNTVFTLQINPEENKKLKEQALKAGIRIGSGYGDWKESTFRIANFPAIQNFEFDTLKQFISDFAK